MKERIDNNRKFSRYFTIFLAHIYGASLYLGLRSFFVLLVVLLIFSSFAADDATVQFTYATESVVSGANENDYPDPGCEWILAPWTPNGSFSLTTSVEESGRVERADAFDIEIIRRNVERVKVPRRLGGAILFTPPVDREAAERFCRELLKTKRRNDRVFLTNGDVFSCDVLGVERRWVHCRVLGEEIAVPRKRVRAIRWKDDSFAN